MPLTFRLRELLADRRMSQSELARRSGVSFATINAVTANRTVRVDLATLDRLAAALDIEPGALFQREPGALPRSPLTKDHV